MKKSIVLLAVFAMVLALAPAAQAVVLSDGHTGDYRIIFVTLEMTPANETTIGFYNTFVTTQAGLAGSTETKDLATTWTAVGSTKLTSAAVNTGTTGAGTGIHIYTPQGSGNYQLVATSYTDLWDSSIATGIHYGDGTEAGSGNGLGEVAWTGTNPNGTTRPTGADGSYLGSGPGGDGTATYVTNVRGGYTDSNWITGPSRNPDAPQSMMGMSGVIGTSSSLGTVWDGGPGDWSDSNWSTGNAPDPAGDMTIDHATGNAVTVSAGTTANSLAIGANNTASLVIDSGGTLAVTTSVTVGSNGTVTVNDGGSLTLQDITLNGAGALLNLNKNTLVLTSTAKTLAAIDALKDAGQITVTGTSPGGKDRRVGYASTAAGEITLGYAAPGDSNMDGQSNFFDNIPILASGKYNTPDTSALWSEGDYNNDTVANFFDLIDVLAHGSYNSGTAYDAVPGGGATSDGQMSLVYDATTGELLLETDGQASQFITINSAGGLWSTPINFQSAALGGLLGNDLGDFAATFGNPLADWNWGAILPDGLTEAQVLADLTVTSSEVPVDLRYVPEPGTLVLLLMAGGTLLLWRRR